MSLEHRSGLSSPMHEDDGTTAIIPILAIGLHRALARRHGWNESLLGHATQVRVATGDQTRISPNAPRPGAPETTR